MGGGHGRHSQSEPERSRLAAEVQGLEYYLEETSAGTLALTTDAARALVLDSPTAPWGPGADCVDRRMVRECPDRMKKNWMPGKLAILLRKRPADAMAAACGDDKRNGARHGPSFAIIKIKPIVLIADSPLLLSHNLINEGNNRWLTKLFERIGGPRWKRQ